MKENLFVSVLGNRNSGKSRTWNTLFNRTVRTGKHKLHLADTEYVEVFLISGSPEERKKYVGEIVASRVPRIVLCSMQYKANVTETIEYFAERDYSLFVHWLNPGYKGLNRVSDSLRLIPKLLSYDSLVGIRDGKIDPGNRAQEMRDFIYGWAKSRRLLKRNR